MMERILGEHHVHRTHSNSDDEEKVLSHSGAKEALNNSNSEKPTDRPPVVVIRNTNLNIIPNLTLNVHNQVGRGELYVVAMFGIVLQLGVLVYFGIAARYLRPTLLKDEEPVADYAFPCTAAGTLLLAVGMLVCGHIVENSTLETNYRPVAGKEARVIWLQRAGTVNDQAFKPFAVFPNSAQTLLTTSQRQIPDEAKNNHEPRNVVWNEEVKAVIGTMVCLCGYIAQFIGLRGMHWSASIAQLGAIGVMTVLRAWVRRNLAQLPKSQPLTPEHELDWLAMTLAADRSKAPWLDLSRVTGDRRSRPWADGKKSWDWKVTAVQDPVNCEGLEAHLGSANNWSKADEVMKTRRDLGKHADWHGPASAEAISLKRAIEITMDTLFSSPFENPGDDSSDDPGKGFTENFSWSLEVSGEPVHFRLERERGGSWKAFSDELEAALSLWLYSTHDVEQGMDEAKAVNHESEVDSKHGNTWRLENRKADKRDIRRDRITIGHDDDDGWLQVKGTLSRRSLRILGSFSPSLRQDLRWWMPDGADSVIEIETNEPTDEVGTAKVEMHRIVGFVSGWDCDPPSKTRRYRVLSSEPDETVSDTIFAAESYNSLKTLFAQYMFSAFMWAAAKTMEKPMHDPQVEVRPTVTDGQSQNSWQFFTLHSAQLSKLAQNIQSTGIGTLEEVYLCIIPPLSINNRLPQPDAIIQWTRKHAQPHEQLGRWYDAGDAYLWLFRTSQAFPKQEMIANKATALLMEYLRVVMAAIKLRKDQQFDFQTIYNLDNLRMRLLKELESARQDVLERIMALYRTQHRSWKCHLVQETGNIRPEDKTLLQFTDMHETASKKHPEYIWVRRSSNDRDILDWTPLHYAVITNSKWDLEELFNYRPDVNAQDVRGQTPLHIACRQNDDWDVRCLLREGAVVNIQDIDGLSPLHCAVSYGNSNMVRSLIEAGADVNLADSLGMSPLFWAAYKGHLSQFRDLWDNANRISRDHNGRTLLHLAAIADVNDIVDRKQMVEALVDEFGVDKDAKDRSGRTSLHFAARAGHTGIVKLLVEGGSDIEAKKSDKSTPLCSAVKAGHTDVVKLLIENGADIDARTNYGEMPLDFARSLRYEAIVQLLVENGASERPSRAFG